MVDIELQMISPTLFFRYLKGRCHGNQFSGKNGAKLPTLYLLLCHSETEWDITTAMCALTAQVMPLYCVKNFMKFGPVTPELTLLICERQVRHGQKTGAF